MLQRVVARGHASRSPRASGCRSPGSPTTRSSTAALQALAARRGRRAALERRDREGDPRRRRARRRQLRCRRRAAARERAPAGAARPRRLAELAATIGADVPFFLARRATARHRRRHRPRACRPAERLLGRAGRSRRARSRPRPATSTRAFDARNGADGLRGAPRGAARGARDASERPQRPGRCSRRTTSRRRRSRRRLRERARSAPTSAAPARASTASLSSGERPRQRPRRCARWGGPGSSHRLGVPTRQACCVYRRGMSGLVVEHRESQFSRRLRRRRVQIAVGIAAVEAILVVAGVLPWWLVVARGRRIRRAVRVGRPGSRARPAFARGRGSPPSPSSSSCWCPSGSWSSACSRSSSSRFSQRLHWPRCCSTGADRPDRRRVHSASRFTGAWPSGKATGFGPVIPGSNPGAPANVPTVSESRPKLAAVVMAGGRGTRMRSATPKHLHPILGRRMVDWIVEAARPLEPDSLVVVVSPDTADQFEGLTTAVQEQRARDGGCGAMRRGGSGRRRRGARPLRRHAAADDRAARRRCSRRIARTAPARPCSRSSRTTSAATGASSAMPTATSSRSSRRAMRSPEQLEIGEANSSIYVFRADLLWPALGRLQPVNAQGELYLTDAVRDLVAAGHRVAVHVAPDPDETEGVNTRVELAAAAAVLRDRINDGAHARRRHDRRSVDDLDRADRDARGRHGRPPVHRDPRRHERRRGRRDRPSRRRDRRRDRSCRDRRALLLRSPGYGSGCAIEGRHVRRGQEHAGSTRVRRFPISAISATRRSVQERTSARDRSRRISITIPASQRSAR